MATPEASLMSPRPEPVTRVPPGFEDEFPDGSALSTDCVLNMGLLVGAVVSHMRSMFRDAGLPSAAAFNVLAVVDGAGGSLPPSVIAERVMVSRPAITSVLHTLERRGMILRRPDPDDGRGRVASITSTGHAVVSELVPRMHKLERDLMAPLNQGEQHALLHITARLQARIRELDPDVEFSTPA